ncbi:hypothetical protein ALI22I_04360 [Saccharothrix sp. ALI-22-I]|uniref:hypothetical protein n=1 Tax=Saccharothrix sp. ALI-22-I TaxID=1933778 RepID=UPI00097BB494|nr:hypothetical protein [Saccharothrix sp. ALI-22-I]ONI92378.1 hypothetical protein ALI22I_04360 [Saccharothrix sp. ALI-22-I]
MLVHRQRQVLVDRTITNLLGLSCLVSPAQRRAVLASLSMTNQVLARWVRCTRMFPVLFSAGVLGQFGALLAIGARAEPVIPHTLLLVGMVLLAVGGLQCWQVARQALDVAVGACLAPEPQADTAVPDRGSVDGTASSQALASRVGRSTG